MVFFDLILLVKFKTWGMAGENIQAFKEEVEKMPIRSQPSTYTDGNAFNLNMIASNYKTIFNASHVTQFADFFKKQLSELRTEAEHFEYAQYETDIYNERATFLKKLDSLKHDVNEFSLKPWSPDLHQCARNIVKQYNEYCKGIEKINPTVFDSKSLKQLCNVSSALNDQSATKEDIKKKVDEAEKLINKTDPNKCGLILELMKKAFDEWSEEKDKSEKDNNAIKAFQEEVRKLESEYEESQVRLKKRVLLLSFLATFSAATVGAAFGVASDVFDGISDDPAVIAALSLLTVAVVTGITVASYAEHKLRDDYKHFDEYDPKTQKTTRVDIKELIDKHKVSTNFDSKEYAGKNIAQTKQYIQTLKDKVAIEPVFDLG